jgi:parallel beta-helix repeat protein
MNLSTRASIILLSAHVLVCGVSASVASASDGVVLIDMNRALAGGITPGDAPGFPVTISQSGSYRLSGNLTVPANTNGLIVAADGVTIDLNGFRILGGGSGIGIFDGGNGRAGVAIRNGSISGFDRGIQLASARIDGTAANCEVQQIRAFSNSSVGIQCGENALITGNTATGSETGVNAGPNSTISANTLSRNGEGLVLSENSTISGNTLSGNRVGLFVFCPSLVSGNAILGNTTAIGTAGPGCVFANNNPATP